jgi:hypothetical protein
MVSGGNALTASVRVKRTGQRAKAGEIATDNGGYWGRSMAEPPFAPPGTFTTSSPNFPAFVPRARNMLLNYCESGRISARNAAVPLAVM